MEDRIENKKETYDRCYEARRRVELFKGYFCRGVYENIQDMIVDRNCLLCPYLDPIRKEI